MGQQENLFQSTPSSQKVTLATMVILLRGFLFQSTPSSQKVTPHTTVPDARQGISIHTFLTEGDARAEKILANAAIFQSTPSSQKVTPKQFINLINMIFQSTPSSQKVTGSSRD